MISKEENIRIFKATLDFLEKVKPEGVCVEDYFYGDNQDVNTLDGIYAQFIASAQNYQRMPNVIAFYNREEEIKQVLFNYDIHRIAELSEDDLYRQFRETFSVKTPDNKRNSWYKWSCSIIDSARFLCGFNDAADFDQFVKRFDYNVKSRIALPLLIQSQIRGIGFALACDLLKELGYTNYPKPDVHLIDVFNGIGLCDQNPISVFEAIEKMADDYKSVDSCVDAYTVDKVFWLLCSGFYYKENPMLRVKSRKKELIEYLKKQRFQ